MFSMSAPFPMDWKTSISRLPMQHPVKESEEEIDYDLYIEPWVGWRSWNIIAGNDMVRLQSITYKVTWVPEEEFVAHCIDWGYGTLTKKQEPHKSPDKECGCGVYAVSDKYEAQRWCDHVSFAGSPENKLMRCFGEVNLWGVVYRYTRGYLAEKAYPKKLFVPHITPDNFPMDARECVHELKRAYRGVDVRLL